MANKQIQEAGANSQQFQAGNNIILNVGIDEKRAREIYQEMNLQQMKEYSKEAYEIANLRITKFENILLPKMEAVEGALEVFADPSFQFLLVEAQKTAASTERSADYELLSELLIHRFQKGNDRVIKAGISHAIKIVDEISDDALLGLTVFHSVSYFIPTSGVIQLGLITLNDLFGRIIYRDLPIGTEWLDHLDILNAIRVSKFGNLKKIEKFYSGRLKGYTDVGIKKNSDNYNIAIELLNNNGLSHNLLIDHELNNDYVRISVPTKEYIDFSQYLLKDINNGQLSNIPTPFTEKQRNVIKSIYDMYNTDTNTRQQNENKFIEEWNKQPNLCKLRDWWNNINDNIRLTSVGRVLAHSNAQRCDKTLPPLN